MFVRTRGDDSTQRWMSTTREENPGTREPTRDEGPDDEELEEEEESPPVAVAADESGHAVVAEGHSDRSTRPLFGIFIRISSVQMDVTVFLSAVLTGQSENFLQYASVTRDDVAVPCHSQVDPDAAMCIGSMQ
ncbi:hypothetical protein F2P81_020533 [Scophthalmus maximus]|uniref:Uncharacterized protein n=1 Tax=Scophthalmus maximus TaxID=52904 RepID=A0A6A4SAH4_SCOMX|nr:hypothetical protein F2P81_020533 [Scophthalmus maximus]